MVKKAPVISSAKFVSSYVDYTKCPKSPFREFAFIGRSNVGKSSLINMITGVKNLAKTSQTPGKTKLINLFLINDNFYLTDLPGYGYAKVSRTEKNIWQKFIVDYLIHRENLHCLFVLIDSRHPPQKIDIEFINWLGSNGIPFVIAFTKADKLSKNELASNISKYKKFLLESWEELPPVFITSAEKQLGKEEILNFLMYS